MSRVLSLITCLTFVTCVRGETLWIEAEKPAKANVVRHPWYSDVQRHLLSGGDFISHWDATKAGEVEYVVKIAKAGAYDFWVRANPTGTNLSYQLDNGSWTPIDMTKNQFDVVNIAPKNALDIRFLAWVKVGKLTLKKGEARLSFRMDSKNNHHGMLDCFVFTDEPFEPRGTRKPGEPTKIDEKGWFAFEPRPETFQEGPLDLRHLNEKMAGEHGVVRVQGSKFATGDGRPVRFWAVNGPASKDLDGLTDTTIRPANSSRRRSRRSSKLSPQVAVPHDLTPMQRRSVAASLGPYPCTWPPHKSDVTSLESPADQTGTGGASWYRGAHYLPGWAVWRRKGRWHGRDQRTNRTNKPGSRRDRCLTKLFRAFGTESETKDIIPLALATCKAVGAAACSCVCASARSKLRSSRPKRDRARQTAGKKG